MVGGWLRTVGELSHRFTEILEAADDVCKACSGPEATAKTTIINVSLLVRDRGRRRLTIAA
jgi:hypothetical protein